MSPWPDVERLSTPERRRRLLVAIGLLLVLSPVIGHLSGYTQPKYEYRIRPVEPAGDSISSEPFAWDFGTNGVAGVACTTRDFHEPVCPVADRYVAGNVTAARPVSLRDRPRYVAHDGALYAWTQRRAENDTVLIRLRPVSAAAVLENVSRPLAEQPRPIRRAWGGGEARSHRRFDPPGRVVARDGEYGVVYRHGPWYQNELRWPFRYLPLVGLLLLARAWLFHSGTTS